MNSLALSCWGKLTTKNNMIRHVARGKSIFLLITAKKWLFQVAHFCKSSSLAHRQAAQISPNLNYFWNLNLCVRNRPFGAGYPPNTLRHDHAGPRWFSAKSEPIVNIFDLKWLKNPRLGLACTAYFFIVGHMWTPLKPPKKFEYGRTPGTSIT